MLRFDEETHTYWLKLPSVSELVRRIKGDLYTDIPDGVLKKAAEFGTAVHEAIELYNITGLKPDLPDKGDHCLSEWKRLRGDIKVLESEQAVHFKDQYAGTFDLICEDVGKIILADYKTTSKLHTENVTLQLNLYRMAYEWQTGKKIDGLRVYWLPKRQKGKAVDLEIIPNEALEVLIEQANEGNSDPEVS